MYDRPSTSVMRDPDAERMNSGVPPTALNARTGLFTPPGMIFRARVNRRADAEATFRVYCAPRASARAASRA
jgi:hypothetical protein